jgi:hypothetical protein
MTDNFERALQERLLARSQVSPREIDALRVYARTLPARRSFWRGRPMALALAGAAVVLAVAVALPPLISRVPGFGTETPTPSNPAATSPAPTPSAPTPTSVPLPSVGIGTVRLLTASGSTVSVAIDDPDDLVSGAEAEQAEATMSVRWFDSIVEQVGPSSIRVTWVGFPRDEEVRLEVSRGGELVLHFVQDAPPPQSDGLGEDRVLVLELSEPIAASDVEVTFSTP